MILDKSCQGKITWYLAFPMHLDACNVESDFFVVILVIVLHSHPDEICQISEHAKSFVSARNAAQQSFVAGSLIQSPLCSRQRM